MGDIAKCSMCNRHFLSAGGKICHRCLDQIDIDFSRLRDYIDRHPNHSGIEEISEQTGVPQKTVLYLLKEGRLSVSSDSSGALLCQICHEPLSSGTICLSCRQRLSRDFASALPKKAKKTEQEPKNGSLKSSGMHLDHKNRR